MYGYSSPFSAVSMALLDNRYRTEAKWIDNPVA